MKGRHRIVRVTGGRVAVTNTSTISNADVDRALRFVAKHADLHGVIVHAKKCGRYRASYGCAYSGIPRIANLNGLKAWQWDYLITVTDAGGFDRFVETLAHEAKHIEQFREGTTVSEVACRAFQGWVMERWAEA